LIEIRISVDKGRHVQVHASLNHQYGAIETLSEEAITTALSKEIDIEGDYDGTSADSDLEKDGPEPALDDNEWKKVQMMMLTESTEGHQIFLRISSMVIRAPR
jgi:hypothetical protein